MIWVNEGEDVYVTETVYDRETGLPRRQVTTLNGELHSPPDGSPSEIIYDKKGRATNLDWHHRGKPHRKNGPSGIVIKDPDTGVHTCEVFETHGEPRAPDRGPHRVYRDPQTGKLWHIQYAGDDSPIVGNVAAGLVPVPDDLEP